MKNHPKISIVQGDITAMQVDAVVNAANPTLLGGGGVDGAIHQAGGPELTAECRSLKGCRTGSAKITRGYNLPAKYVIHTVGPVWHGGKAREEELLRSCYRSCMQLAVEHGLQSIAFPAISCGVYGFPISKAVPLAVDEVSQFHTGMNTIEEVFFVCSDEKIAQTYREILGRQPTLSVPKEA